LDEASYKNALKYFNRKSLSRQISSQFNLKNGEYQNIVLRLIKTEKKSGIVEALSSFTPTIRGSSLVRTQKAAPHSSTVGR